MLYWDEIMIYARAKTANNKLEVMDNRVFVIHIELLERGFMVTFTDIKEGKKHNVAYASRPDFDKEWILCSCWDGTFEEFDDWENGYTQ